MNKKIVGACVLSLFLGVAVGWIATIPTQRRIFRSGQLVMACNAMVVIPSVLEDMDRGATEEARKGLVSYLKGIVHQFELAGVPVERLNSDPHCQKVFKFTGRVISEQSPAGDVLKATPEELPSRRQD
jgi:hypothetical protein